MEELLLESGPTEYEEKPGWGDQKRITVGAKLRTNDWKVRIEKRHKEVNDGLWRHYKVWLDRPKQNLKVKIAGLRRIGDGRVAFTTRIIAPLGAFARHTQWERGLQLYSISAEATAKVELKLEMEVGFRVVPKGYFLAVAVEPAVVGVDLKLHDFELDRISKFAGNPANAPKGTTQKQLSKRESKLKLSLNASIAKRIDRLTLSPADLAKSAWSKVRKVGE